MVDAQRELAREQPDAVSDEPLDPEVNAREWLVTNGLGGYASGTVSGIITRRFHGVLVAALPAPHGRTMMLNYLAEMLVFADGRMVRLGSQERPSGPRARPSTRPSPSRGARSRAFAITPSRAGGATR